LARLRCSESLGRGLKPWLFIPGDFEILIHMVWRRLLATPFTSWFLPFVVTHGLTFRQLLLALCSLVNFVEFIDYYVDYKRAHLVDTFLSSLLRCLLTAANVPACLRGNFVMRRMMLNLKSRHIVMPVKKLDTSSTLLLLYQPLAPVQSSSPVLLSLIKPRLRSTSLRRL
jgi:hypothetical protein